MEPSGNQLDTSIASGTGNRKWDTMYNHLLEYKNNHGDCLVPNRYTDMPQLGSWVSTQRRHYKLIEAGKDSPLTQTRLELLTKIGFVWATRDPRHVPWEQRYQELLEYKNKHGNCLIPVGYEGNPQLANWVSTQRQEWKSFSSNKPSRLTEERVALLNKVGFVWEAHRGGARKRKSNDSISICAKKSCSPPKSVPPSSKQANENVNGTLNHERPWIAMFKDYLWFLDQGRNPEGVPELKTWADEQREEHKVQQSKKSSSTILQSESSKLTLDQYNLLQSIGFDWKLQSLKNSYDIHFSQEAVANNYRHSQFDPDNVHNVSTCNSDTTDTSKKDYHKDGKSDHCSSTPQSSSTNVKKDVLTAQALFSLYAEKEPHL